MELLKINISLVPDGFYSNIYKIEVKETEKSYVFLGNRISKDKIMKIDTDTVENHKVIMYHTYCFDHQKDEAINMLVTHCKTKIISYKNSIDEKIAHIDNHYIKNIKTK